MRAGQLNQRITVQQLAAGQDALGQPMQTWSTVAELWAHILHSSGIEMVKAGAEMSIVRASIRVRYTRQITAGMRVVADGFTYNVTAVLPDMEGKQYTDLTCEIVS